jgi:hypothetical protein
MYAIGNDSKCVLNMLYRTTEQPPVDVFSLYNDVDAAYVYPSSNDHDYMSEMTSQTYPQLLG